MPGLRDIHPGEVLTQEFLIPFDIRYIVYNKKLLLYGFYRYSKIRSAQK